MRACHITAVAAPSSSSSTSCAPGTPGGGGGSVAAPLASPSAGFAKLSASCVSFIQSARLLSSAMMRWSSSMLPKVMSMPRFDSTMKRLMILLTCSASFSRFSGWRSSAHCWCKPLDISRKVAFASPKTRASARSASVQYFTVSTGPWSSMVLRSEALNAFAFTRTWFCELSTAYSVSTLATWLRSSDWCSSGRQTSRSRGSSGRMRAQASLSLTAAASFSPGFALRRSSSARRTAASMMKSRARRCLGLMGSMLGPRRVSPTRQRLTIVPQCDSAGARFQNAPTARSAIRRWSPT
mmetsp:Transcript_44677/g.115604  ORF Transcript_44677/g.115604 Transcript_44677/m.115604 type:complete len:296 (+) Transcript_44677:1178-2065(+)